MMLSCVKLIAVAVISHTAAAAGSAKRSSSADRLRSPDSASLQSGAIASMIPSYERFFQSLAEGPINFLNMVAEEKAANDALLEEEKDEYDAIMEVFESLASNLAMSMSMQTSGPTAAPSLGAAAVSDPVVSDTAAPSVTATVDTTAAPQALPSIAPTPLPTVEILAPVMTTEFPSDPPTPLPTRSLTAAPTIQQTSAPTLANCPGITAEERGKATEWILSEDEFQVCPDDPKLVQRWALAVMYFATGGENWFQCSANPAAMDNCGAENPFIGSTPFLSATRVCNWAGISCIDGCVTEIEFEENNFFGTIPTEMGLLTDLLIWGMERGRLSSTIPTEIAQLTNLVFLDLDYNELTGTLTTELLSLQSLAQLDLNNNKLSGNIEGIGSLPNIEFLQLHDNLFTGTVPASIGSLINMSVFTLHESLISGDMPQEVCDLLSTADQGGVLTSLIADCTPPNPSINCDCCTDCRIPQL